MSELMFFCSVLNKFLKNKWVLCDITGCAICGVVMVLK